MNTIGIFDSGIGGLGIFKEIKKNIPNKSVVYLADNNNLPFGAKKVEQMHQITEAILKFLIKKHHIKIAVVACNTATVTSIKYLRQKFSIPIIGVVPVVKPACKLSKTKRVAIMATPLTTQSDYQKNLITQFARNTKVFSIPCPGLVEFIEEGKLDSQDLYDNINQNLQPILRENIDVLGLGCTHFPFVKKQIAQTVGPNVTILDSNKSVAKQVVRVLQTLAQEKQYNPSYIFYSTKNPDSFQNIAQSLIDEKIEKVHLAKL
jgi:glutamate racemase